MRIITDSDAGEYVGYVVLDNESDRLEARARRKAARSRDEIVGVVDRMKRCTCDAKIAGDCISVENCERHGMTSFVVTECCYCAGPCDCGWSKLTSKQLAYVRYLNA